MHLEVVQNMEIESLIQTLINFIARRGNIKLIRCLMILILTGQTDMEEQPSFKKPYRRGLGALDKIGTCDTVSIIEVEAIVESFETFYWGNCQ